jgi:hypothetical protein
MSKSRVATQTDRSRGTDGLAQSRPTTPTGSLSTALTSGRSNVLVGSRVDQGGFDFEETA